jgi:hypothetical protein
MEKEGGEILFLGSGGMALPMPQASATPLGSGRSFVGFPRVIARYRGLNPGLQAGIPLGWRKFGL